MRVKCLAQEHNTMSPARARTRTARSEVERTNHEATAPPTVGLKMHGNYMIGEKWEEINWKSFLRFYIPTIRHTTHLPLDIFTEREGVCRCVFCFFGSRFR